MPASEQIQKFEELVQLWQNGKAPFAVVIHFALVDLSIEERQLAINMEVAETTINRWALGIARPHPKIQELAIEAIRSMIQ